MAFASQQTGQEQTRHQIQQEEECLHQKELCDTVEAVHEVCDFLHQLSAAKLQANYTGHGNDNNRFPPIKLAAQALLTARLKASMPFDTFITEFRDNDPRKPISYADMARIRQLLAFAEKDRVQKDTSLQKDNTIRAHLDGGGKIHKGGINPYIRGRGPHTPPSVTPMKPVAQNSRPGSVMVFEADDWLDENQYNKRARPIRYAAHVDRPTTQPAMPHSSANPWLSIESMHQRGLSDVSQHTRSSSGSNANVNRVWVLEPLDDLAAYRSGRPYCVGATLFRNGDQILTVIGILNTSIPARDEGTVVYYGEIHFAARSRGASKQPIGFRVQGECEALKLDPRDPRLKALPGPHGFPRLDIMVPIPSATFPPDARGGLAPTNTTPGRSNTPTGPAASRQQHPSYSEQFQLAEVHVSNRDMHGTGPTLTELLSIHAGYTTYCDSSLLRYIAVATGQAHASIVVPNTAGSNGDASIWREAGGSLLVQEAGGVVTDAEGQELEFTTGRTLRNNFGVLATVPGLTHWRLLDAIKGDFHHTRWMRDENLLRPTCVPLDKALPEDLGPEKVADLPYKENGVTFQRPSRLRCRAHRRYAKWQANRETWKGLDESGSLTGTGQWAKETMRREVRVGQDAPVRYFPDDHPLRGHHPGPCMWPCYTCEPNAAHSWYAGSCAASSSSGT